MKPRDPRATAPPAQPPQSPADRLSVQLRSFLEALRRSPDRRRLILLAAGIGGVVCGNAVGQILLNKWQGTFWDAVGQRDIAAFVQQLLLFAAIVAGLLVFGVGQTWLQEVVKTRLREALTRDLLGEWLQPRRAYRLAMAGEIGVNPDQRIQEDSRHLCELTADLGTGLLQASLLLVSFVSVLWLLSEQVVFSAGGRNFTIPGYMVWCALIYAATGSWLTWTVGRPLIRMHAERYAREADFRFALVRANESAEGIALYGGEADEGRLLNAALDRTLTVMLRLARGLARLTWITSGYGWVALVVPVVVASPGYFAGTLSLGALMMVVGAFLQVQQALRWYVDNFSRIAEWRATLLRVMTFRATLPALEELEASEERITYAEHLHGKLVLESLRVSIANGSTEVDGGWVEIEPGERVVIAGEPGSGKSTLFLAIAGLWPWGRGTVYRPPAETMMFLPRRPYMPLGTLRTVLTYPRQAARFSDAAVKAALERVGLARLVSKLDRVQRWDKELRFDEQQRLAFARMLLHAPKWVVMDEAMSALDDESAHIVMSIFRRELAAAAVVNIGRAPPNQGFFSRTLHLRRVPEGPLPPLRAVGGPAAKATVPA
ncbi:MAG: ABC transporter ATP-binding protein/permease [Rhodospirillaceae bacterium]|nr:ABC transporter ATP-binding protein/permease [Rhodospirillaceae bacterium]